MGGEPTDERSDEALMIAHAAGDRAAFKALFSREAPRLMRLVRRHVDNDDLARDLVQQTFTQLHAARHDFRHDARLRPWVTTIALNLVRQHYRRRKVRKEDSIDEAAPVRAADDTVAPLERAERAAQLRAAVGQLPDGQREVVVLHWFEERSFAEVAQLVGASEGAVRVRAHRAYGRLRELLGDALP